MPRTRTKFIWPPPNLVGDHTDQQQHQHQQQQPQKKQKLESTEQHRNSDNSPAPSESTQSAQVEWDPTSNVAPPSFEAAVRAYLQMPLEKVIKNYQTWRRTQPFPLEMYVLD